MSLQAAVLAIVLTVASGQQFRIALWGDMPYLGNSADVFNVNDTYGRTYQAFRDSMNADSSIAFGIHAGDIKSGSTLCNDLVYGRFQDLANSLNYPSALTPGDNEWTDCHRSNNGNYTPTERLSVIRQRFFNGTNTTAGRTILGKGTPLQTLGFGVAPYIENQYFVRNGVMFGILHVVGSNNNLYGADQACPSTLNAVDPNCTGQNAEFAARDTATNNALRAVFANAKAQNLRAILIGIQADFYGGNAATCNARNVTIENVANTTRSGFRNFMTAFLTESANYTGRVALFHGDSHVYRLCNPTNLTNVQFIQTPGAENFGWVRTTIDASAVNANNIFTFEDVTISVVPNPPVPSPVAAPIPAPVAPPIAAPVAAPVVAPVSVPAPLPAVIPTAPVKAPTKAPTTPVAPVKAPTAAPVAAPTRERCGLFRLNFICLNGCGLFGRLFKFCKN